MKKQWFNYVFVIALIFVTAWIILTSEGVSDLPNLLLKTHKIYILLGVLSMAAYWVFDALILDFITKMVHKKGNFIRSLKFTMIGQYYSLITPFSSGGQPAQVYSMANASIPLGKATSILINKFIIYQIVVTLYSIVMFIIKMRFVYSSIKMALPFVIIGITLNFIGLITIFILFLNPKLLKNTIISIFNFINKIKKIENIELHIQKIEHHIKEYEVGIKKIKENWALSAYIAILTILQLTFYFSITYFIYLALGFRKASYIDIISIQSLLYMAVSFIPTPGTVGASEGGFYLLFNVFFAQNVLVYAIVLWRIISYYLNLVISGIVTLVDYMLRRKKKILLEE